VDRRAFVGSLALGILAALRGAEAQQAGKVFRVGFLSGRIAANPDLGAFKLTHYPRPSTARAARGSRV
jgi:hypothetical protein